MSWATVRFGDAGRWLSGGTPRTSEPTYWGGDLPWLSAASLTEFRIRDAERRVSRLGAENGTRLVPPGTLLMVVRGMSLKTEFRMGITDREVAFGQDCKAVLPHERFDPLFLAYAVRAQSREVLDLVDEAGHGTGRLQMDLLQELPIPSPPKHEQRGIAATLGALDDKIDSNRRAVDIAASLGESLFRDSVGAKRVLSDVANVTMGSSPPGSTYNEDRVGLPFYQGVRDFGVRHPSRRVWTHQPVRTAGANATLISVRAPVGRLNRATELCCIGRGLASVTSKYPSVCFYALLAADSVWRPFEQEGTVFGSMNRQSLTSAPVPWPEMREIDSLEARLASLDSEITSLTEENMKLGSLRDALLPELLSGRIRVPEAAAVLVSQ
ncbi:restriction endonuclease subunit S [Nesterenkonia haasae]|uniref:restriction endonuclease subunit S n=1 Tax=Nesterenkonia haasae TaxID=2587813 RepID=UPI001390A0D8|nr:restriction endonuclease subunit S [Nesterenkonia haasae]